MIGATSMRNVRVATGTWCLLSAEKCPRCNAPAEFLQRAVPMLPVREDLNVIWPRECLNCGYSENTEGSGIPMPFTPQFSAYSVAVESVRAGRIACMCGQPFTVEDLFLYDSHEGGIFVPYKDGKCWVYAQCRNKKCQYQMAWWKFKNWTVRNV